MPKKSPECSSNAIEVLAPLRWHLDEILNGLESHNRFLVKMGEKPILESKIKEARDANNKANVFFSS